MGLNTVAVLFNDHHGEIERNGGDLGKRIADAMRTYQRDSLRGWFGAGRIISCSHADYDQVVIVGQNRGRLANDANDLSYGALDTMAECLRRHGRSAAPPKRRKKATLHFPYQPARGMFCGGDAT